MAVAIQPRAVIVSVALDDQRVCLPMRHRIPHPTGIGVALQFAPVHENLAIREIFVQHEDLSWGLNDLGPACAVDGVGTVWQALEAHVLSPEVRHAALDQSLRRGLDLAWFEVRRNVRVILRHSPLPYA